MEAVVCSRDLCDRALEKAWDEEYAISTKRRFNCHCHCNCHYCNCHCHCHCANVVPAQAAARAQPAKVIRLSGDDADRGQDNPKALERSQSLSEAHSAVAPPATASNAQGSLIRRLGTVLRSYSEAVTSALRSSTGRRVALAALLISLFSVVVLVFSALLPCAQWISDDFGTNNTLIQSSIRAQCVVFPISGLFLLVGILMGLPAALSNAMRSPSATDQNNGR